MAKRQISSAISADLKAASADSFADNIKMLDVTEIISNKDNFYALTDIEPLADDIERQNLKHNLVVVKDEDSGKYLLISGHRRLEAVKLLISEGRRTSTKVPCYIGRSGSEAENKLDLIMLNKTQRKYSDADVMQEYERLTETLKELESEGKKINGRLRENIADMLNVSSAQIGKIENIKHNAIPDVENAVKSGEMSISTANEVAKLAPEQQEQIIKEKPDITHKEVKEIQKSSPPKPRAETAPEVKKPTTKVEKIEAAVNDTDEKADPPKSLDPPDPIEYTEPTANISTPCTLSAEETAALGKYIDQLINLVDEEDETIIKGIADRLSKG